MTTRLTTLDVPFAHDKITLLVDVERMKRISKEFGGIVPAWQRINAMDPLAYTTIVAIGAEKTIGEVEIPIYEQGLEILHKPLDKYLNLLVNGGREPVEPTVAA